MRLNISPEVVDKSQRSLRDLRVVDENRELVPHIVHFEQPATELVWREVVLMNQVYREGEYARAVLNFGGRKIRNRVRVRLTGEDFAKSVFASEPITLTVVAPGSLSASSRLGKIFITVSLMAGGAFILAGRTFATIHANRK